LYRTSSRPPGSTLLDGTPDEADDDDDEHEERVTGQWHEAGANEAVAPGGDPTRTPDAGDRVARRAFVEAGARMGNRRVRKLCTRAGAWTGA